jgi:hypothetical protein
MLRVATCETFLKGRFAPSVVNMCNALSAAVAHLLQLLPGARLGALPALM